MPNQNKKTRSRPTSLYRIQNWPAYDQALVQRGSLTFWLSDDFAQTWQALATPQRGAQFAYSDHAITLMLTLREVFHLTNRAVEGLTGSLFALLKLRLAVPDHSTLSRRGRHLAVSLPRQRRGALDVVMDSTGLKVYGEGEWKVRTHGASKRRTWKKIHIGIDERGELRAVEVTDNDVHDSEPVPALLAQEPATIERFAGDGAYDTRGVYDALMERAVGTIRIPPQKNAKIWHNGHSSRTPHPRDQNLREIRKTSRKRWKEAIGYHKRSLVENTMFRFKTVFGGGLRFRADHSQANEVMMRANILNVFFQLGMPEAVPIV